MDIKSGSLIGSMDSKRYSKVIDTRGRRALTSNPGKRNRRIRLASGSMSKHTRKSDNEETEDNPYMSNVNAKTEIDNTTQHLMNEDDQNMINISTMDNLNKTEVINQEYLAKDNTFIKINDSQEHPLFQKQDKIKPKQGKGKRRIQTAKYSSGQGKTMHKKWRGGSQLQAHQNKSKQVRLSEKKK